MNRESMKEYRESMKESMALTSTRHSDIPNLSSQSELAKNTLSTGLVYTTC